MSPSGCGLAPNLSTTLECAPGAENTLQGDQGSGERMVGAADLEAGQGHAGADLPARNGLPREPSWSCRGEIPGGGERRGVGGPSGDAAVKRGGAGTLRPRGA